MNFINYLSYKYKLNRRKPKTSRKETLSDQLAMVFLFIIMTFVIYLIIRVLPLNIQDNMNKYMVGFFAFLCLISLSTATKKYYKEYFLSPEREILLIAPIKSSQIILSRFFIVAIEVAFINTMFFLPFTIANGIAGNISIGMVFITIPQILSMSLFMSAITHFLFAFAFLISKGKGLKAVAYSLMTLSYIGIISVVIFSNNYKSFLFIQNKITETVFYLIFQYPKYLLINHINFIDIVSFTGFIILNSICFILLAYWITAHCYKKGLLTISSRDLEKSFYSAQLTTFIDKSINNHFIKKDLLYIIRSPQLFSSYFSPVLITSLVEYRNHFAASGIFLTFLVNIFSLMIITITLHILMSDDTSQGDLLFTVPINTEKLFKSRSRLLHMITFILTSSYVVLICILESVRVEHVIFALLELFILTYIASRVLLSKVISRSIQNGFGYRYNGSIVKPLIYYFFIWNLPLLVLFTLLHEGLRRIIEIGPLSNQASVSLMIILILVIMMIYKSTRSTIYKKENRQWQM